MPLRQARPRLRVRRPLSDSDDDSLLRDYQNESPPGPRRRAPMVHIYKIRAAQLATRVNLENRMEEPTVDTIVPSMTKAGAPQAESKRDDSKCAIALTRSIIVATQARVGAILDEWITLKSEIEKQASLSAGLRVALQGQTAKVDLLEWELDAILVGLQERVRAVERMWKDAQDDRKNLEIDNRKLADQLSMIRKNVDKVKIETTSLKAALEKSIVHRRKLAKDLVDTRKDASAKKRKMEKAHKTAFEKVEVDHKNSIVLLQRREMALEMKKRDLESECESIRQELSEEKEKGLCQICVESPKDTLCLPCLHFHYCSNCVETHRQRSRTCPLCRTILSGTLRIDISVQS